jgi:hypothetical protein
MVLGFVLFWVACALVYNTASAFGKVDGKETGPVNVIIGSLVVFIVLYGIVTDMFGQGTFWWAAQVLLFAFNFVFFGISSLRGTDGRGPGWYSLFVAVLSPIAVYQATMAGDIKLALMWVSWGILWFLFWLVYALGMTQIARFVRWYQLFCLIVTIYIPGVVLLNNIW